MCVSTDDLKKETQKAVKELDLKFREHDNKEKEYWVKIDKMYLALFGDEELKINGIVKQNEEMYRLVVQASGLKKWMRLFLLVGGVVSILYTIFRRF